MLKEKMLSISIFCLAISIVIGCYFISKGFKGNGGYVESGLVNIGSGLNNISNNLNSYNQNQIISKDNYSLDEAAVYLGITQDKLIKLVDNKGSGIPYVKIENSYIFNKNALAKWLETAKVEME